MPIALVRGVRHYFRLEGPADLPWLVLVHPLGADQGIWDRVTPLLTKRLRILRYDLRGHGGTDTTAGDCGIEMLSRDLFAMADAVGARCFSVAGISIGAMVAMHAAATHGERLQALVVSHALARLPAPPDGWDARTAMVLRDGMVPVAWRMVERQFAPAFRATRDPIIDTVHAACALMDPHGYASASAVLRDADLRPLLPSITVPALVVAGRLDPMLPIEGVRAIADAIPGARFLGLDCGHLSPVELPEDFAREVGDFITAALT